jgi:DNA-binding MarR family transcriptional regulator
VGDRAIGDHAVGGRAVDGLADRLHSAAIHLLRGVARADAESGLSPARLSALSVVVYGGPLTMGALAEAERVSNATITSTVTGLEGDGYVARARGTGDARVVTVAATEAGRSLMARARARRLEMLSTALAGITEREREALAVAVGALERILGEGPH